MNILRCTLWAKYLFPVEEQHTSLAFQTKLHNEHRMLCEKHFNDDDFTDASKKKLLRTAVPCDPELYKTGKETFSPKTTVVEEKVVALLTPQLEPLPNDFDSSAPYYTIDIVETQELNNTQDSSQEVLGAKEDSVDQPQPVEVCKRRISPILLSDSTPRKKICVTEPKKKYINNISASIIKGKNEKQINEDAITTKKLEILEIQLQHERMKLEKTKILLDLDIELKRNLLENSKMDLELKKRNFNL
ncbi:unnamed protein product [Parnassius apollo]|uniref:(apollo) hypothetical protein n=1 Tax=Parnassius apollo TaxID=110799 RepID=A0A8S3XNN2_PARAO|nr:unnamed protein product [Parnassius apollo]